MKTARMMSGIRHDEPLDPLTLRTWQEGDRCAVWLPVRKEVTRDVFVQLCDALPTEALRRFGNPWEWTTALRVRMVPWTDGSLIVRQSLEPGSRIIWWLGDKPPLEGEER